LRVHVSGTPFLRVRPFRSQPAGATAVAGGTAVAGAEIVGRSSLSAGRRRRGDNDRDTVGIFGRTSRRVRILAGPGRCDG
jgi:hypothetical protein